MLFNIALKTTGEMFELHAVFSKITVIQIVQILLDIIMLNINFPSNIC
jgi:hypothetical protein